MDHRSLYRKVKILSRLRDEKGHVVDRGGLWYAPHAFLSALLRISLGLRPMKPWISYRAIKRIDSLITPSWNVLEFGTGMSTIWLARRCNRVISIENNRNWYDKVSRMLEVRHISNVDVRLKDNDTYHIIDDIPDGHFDFALVDGCNRDKCMLTALRKVAVGGFIYLDDTDQFANNPKGHTRIAESILLSHMGQSMENTTYFVDFSPATFFVGEGILARV